MMPKKESPHFVICLNNTNYEASLDVGKVYRVIADKDAASHGYIRVVDESGEDYAFDAHRFHDVEFPPTVEAALDSALR